MAINMWLQYKKIGPWRNYLVGEKVYILLSLTAKAALAWQVTNRYSKDEILALYLNQMYYGGMAYGVDAAAQTYFGKSALDLNLAEAALLAAEAAAEEVVVVSVGDVAAFEVRQLVRQQRRAELVGDLDRDLVLEGEDVGDRPVVAVGPELGAVAGLHEPGRDPDPVARPLDAALEQVVGADGAAHLARVRLLALEGE